MNFNGVKIVDEQGEINCKKIEKILADDKVEEESFIFIPKF